MLPPFSRLSLACLPVSVHIILSVSEMICVDRVGGHRHDHNYHLQLRIMMVTGRLSLATQIMSLIYSHNLTFIGQPRRTQLITLCYPVPPQSSTSVSFCRFLGQGVSGVKVCIYMHLTSHSVLVTGPSPLRGCNTRRDIPLKG